MFVTVLTLGDAGNFTPILTCADLDQAKALSEQYHAEGATSIIVLHRTIKDVAPVVGPLWDFIEVPTDEDVDDKLEGTLQ